MTEFPPSPLQPWVTGVPTKPGLPVLVRLYALAVETLRARPAARAAVSAIPMLFVVMLNISASLFLRSPVAITMEVGSKGPLAIR
jgi:hypothetical protein